MRACRSTRELASAERTRLGSTAGHVLLVQYSDPAKVTFGRTRSLSVTNGQAVTTASFAAPGRYKLIASASDPGRLSAKTEVIVTILGRSTSGQP